MLLSPTSVLLALPLLGLPLLSHATTEDPRPTIPPRHPHDPNLFKRQCAVPCGWKNQYCCSAGSACYTDAGNIARCGSATVAPAATIAATTTVQAAGVATSVTQNGVVVVTAIATAVATASIPGSAAAAAVTPSPTMSCDYANGQAMVNGACVAAGDGGSSGNVFFSTPGSPTDSFTAPLIPTGQGSTSTVSITTTGTGSPTTNFIPPVGTANGVVYSGIATTQTTASTSLTAGQIAGIVIGVILGLILLALICFCFCVGEACAACFGSRNRKTRKEIEEVDIYRDRRGSRSDFSEPPRTKTKTTTKFFSYFRRGRRDGTREDRTSGIKTAAGTAAGIGALAGILGIQRSRSRKKAQQTLQVREVSRTRRAPARPARSEYDDYTETLSQTSESSHGYRDRSRSRSRQGGRERSMTPPRVRSGSRR